MILARWRRASIVTAIVLVAWLLAAAPPSTTAAGPARTGHPPTVLTRQYPLGGTRLCCRHHHGSGRKTVGRGPSPSHGAAAPARHRGGGWSTSAKLIAGALALVVLGLILLGRGLVKRNGSADKDAAPSPPDLARQPPEAVPTAERRRGSVIWNWAGAAPRDNRPAARPDRSRFQPGDDLDFALQEERLVVTVRRREGVPPEPRGRA